MEQLKLSQNCHIQVYTLLRKKILLLVSIRYIFEFVKTVRNKGIKVYERKSWNQNSPPRNKKYMKRGTPLLYKSQREGRFSIVKVEHRENCREVLTHSLMYNIVTCHKESLTDLRYPQEFLGHKSHKSTEISTEVSTKNLSVIKNPLDSLLGVKK